MVTYDSVWSTFMDNYKTDEVDLPQTDEGKYKFIHNATLLFNNRMNTKYKCYDETEMVDGIESDNDLLLLAHYIRLVFLKNSVTYYESLWQPFESDVGIRNFGTQLSSLKNSVKEQERFIEDVIFFGLGEFL